MKPIFKHREAIQLAHDMERNNTYANALIAENKRLQFQVNQTRYSAAEMLDAACEIADENKRLRGEVVELRAERNKGCLYCAGYEAEFMLPVIEMSENTANSLDIDRNFAYIHCHCGRHTVGKINYCPMCGRRLEAQHE